MAPTLIDSRVQLWMVLGPPNIRGRRTWSRTRPGSPKQYLPDWKHRRINCERNCKIPSGRGFRREKNLLVGILCSAEGSEGRSATASAPSAGGVCGSAGIHMEILELKPHHIPRFTKTHLRDKEAADVRIWDHPAGAEAPPPPDGNPHPGWDGEPYAARTRNAHKCWASI